jgi:DNA-directed RNA polymerase subunit RPC12/RpoP
MPPRDDAETRDELTVEGSCTECGAPFRAGIWDHCFHCAYCGSLLLSKRDLDTQVFVVTSRRDLDVIEIIVRRESEHLRSTLAGFGVEGPMSPDVSGIVEARVQKFQSELRAVLSLVESVDFFAPYEVRQRTIFQGILGRRRGRKESFLQAFVVEELARLYDSSRFNLRDRGLKIRGMRLQLLESNHLELSQNRFLECSTPPDFENGLDRSALRLDRNTQIISRIHEAGRERRLKVYKHMSYAHVGRGSQDEHYLIDHQFDGVAGTLAAGEAVTFRELEARPIAKVLVPSDIRAIAAECPNCGWELELPPREHAVFCPTCALGVDVTPEGLKPLSYRAGVAQVPDRSQHVIYFPFWAFPFRVRTEGELHVRIWDWLAAVSRQPLAEQFRETDPAESAFFLPAREIFGTPALDDVFAQLTGWVNWRQPQLRSHRPLPEERTSMLGVELSSEESWRLAPFALLALHDNHSTCRLNGRTFTRYVAQAEPLAGEPFLAQVPLVFADQQWDPGAQQLGSSARGFPRSRIEPAGAIARVTKSFNLP